MKLVHQVAAPFTPLDVTVPACSLCCSVSITPQLASESSYPPNGLRPLLRTDTSLRHGCGAIILRIRCLYNSFWHLCIPSRGSSSCGWEDDHLSLLQQLLTMLSVLGKMTSEKTKHLALDNIGGRTHTLRDAIQTRAQWNDDLQLRLQLIRRRKTSSERTDQVKTKRPIPTSFSVAAIRWLRGMMSCLSFPPLTSHTYANHTAHTERTSPSIPSTVSCPFFFFLLPYFVTHAILVDVTPILPLILAQLC